LFEDRKSFVYNGRSLMGYEGYQTEGVSKYVLAEIEEKTKISMGLTRSMDKGTTNKYKASYDVYGVSYDDPLIFQITIIKNPCIGQDMSITRDESRELISWLTSPQNPQWLYFEDDEYIHDTVRYYGLFTDVEPFFAGNVYGLTFTFTCTSSYAYTFDIVQNYEEINKILITNNVLDGDEWNDYVYPLIHVHPIQTASTTLYGNIVFINLDDAITTDKNKVYYTGYLDSPSGITYLQICTDYLKPAVEQYASNKRMDVVFRWDDAAQTDLSTRGYNHVIMFRLTDEKGYIHRCVAFFVNDERHTYYIIEQGFIYMDMYEGLDIFIDCQKMKCYDSIGRMIDYSTMGLEHIDEFNWIRLKQRGNNRIHIFCNEIADVTFTYSLPRKVGEMYAD